MSSIVLRTCNSEKNCAKCDRTIQKGEKYGSAPYKSLCITCYEEEKKETGEIKSNLANDSYVVTGNCSYCETAAVGILWGKKICAAHINQVLTESI